MATEEPRPTNETNRKAFVFIVEAAALVVTLGGLVVNEPWAFYLWVPAFYVLCLGLWSNAQALQGIGKIIGRGIILLLAGVATSQVVLVSAPIELVPELRVARQPDGVVIGGIKWEPGFAEVQVWFTNPTERDYEDVDMSLRLRGAYVAAIGLIDPTGSARLFDPDPTTVTGEATLPNGAVIRADPIKGETIALPYRLRMERFPRHSTVKVVFAAVDMSPLFEAIRRGGPMPSNRHGPAPRPGRVDINGEYRVAFRTRSIRTALALPKP